ncbi:MAG: transcriptional regulator [Delftia sp. 13_1_40CM_3_66_6]|nr:MAG: transcriptional regulator [Delftia sp. 13_1_40CM_3_66_6]
MTQEDMLMATSRRHMSRVEQGHQIPSVRVIEALAESLQIHPLTLIAAAYCVNLDEASIKLITDTVQLDLQRMVQDHIENGSVSEFS